MTRGSPPNPAAAPSPPSRRLRRRLLFYPPALALGGLTLLGTDPRLKALSFVAFCIFMALPLGLDALSARPNGRMPGWLEWLARRRLSTTREGAVFLVLTVLFGVAAINTGTNLLYLLLSLLLSMIVASGVLSELNVKGLQLMRALPPAVFAGEVSTLYVSVHNPRRWLPAFIIEVAERRGPFGPEGETTRGPAVLLPRLDPGERHRIGFRHRFVRRGVFTLEGFELRTRFPFGFFIKYAYARLPAELVVYPRLRPIRRALWQRHGRRPGGRRRSPYLERSGETFHSLRPYRPGDSRRSIHWRSSARLARLHVKQFAPERTPRIAIVVDRHPGAAGRAHGEQAGTEQAATRALDRVADLAASLTAAFAAAGFEVRTVIAGGEAPEVVPATGGARPSGRWLEALARMKPLAAGEADGLAAAIATAGGRASECYVVTARTAAALRAGAGSRAQAPASRRLTVLEVSSAAAAERYYEPTPAPIASGAAADKERCTEP